MVIAAAVIFIFFLLPSNALATVEYAQQTGKGCAACHIDPAGGGQLTQEGEAFRDELRIRGLYRPLTRTQHIVRFIIGYLHSMTAIVWFGAILYVHILLKPAYAARGLPKGELILGWSSIVIMAVTGTMLSIARVPSWDALLHSRFGVLLTIKVSLFLIMVATAFVVTFVIGPRMRKKKDIAVSEHKQDLTAGELLQFDGEDGRPSYVSYNGIIYDVTQSRLWQGGSHMRKHRAGADLTAVLGTAPHGEDRITRMPVVGRLLASRESGRAERPTFFYLLAYMNLAIVFLIVFVISLWRWW